MTMDDARRNKLIAAARGTIKNRWPGLSAGQTDHLVQHFLGVWADPNAGLPKDESEVEFTISNYVLVAPESVRPIPSIPRVKEFMLREVLNTEARMALSRKIDQYTADELLE